MQRRADQTRKKEMRNKHFYPQHEREKSKIHLNLSSGKRFKKKKSIDIYRAFDLVCVHGDEQKLIFRHRFDPFNRATQHCKQMG